MCGGEAVQIEIREARGLPQDELAHLAEIHTTYPSGVENGRRNITLNVLERIAGALRRSPAELVTQTDPD